MDRCTTCRSPSQSIPCSGSPARPSFAKTPTFTLPRLQTSYGRRGCSPQGFVASYDPSAGTGLYSLARSMKKTPGSPVFQAPFTIMSKISRAFSRPANSPLRGVIRSYSSSFATASMKASVIATEMLKFVICEVSFLQRMNTRMSGWSTRRIPMFAPRRVPPCFTTSVDAS